LSTKIKEKEISYRRSKIIELKSQGLSQAEIARKLQVTDATVSLDMRQLREQAKASINLYLTEYLPQQYQLCLVALDTILKRSFDMIENARDNREKLQAMELFKDTHMTKLQLLSNAVTIDHALRYVQSKQQQQEQQSEETEESEDTEQPEEAAEQDQEPEHTNTAASGTGKQTVF
jgi:DNA-binding CsgD family transcriptional regulator